MRRTLRTRSVAASVAVLATIAFAACGDDDDATDTTDARAATEVEETTAPDDTATAATEGTTEESTDGTEGSTPSSGSGEVGGREEYVAAATDEIGSEFEDQDISNCIGEAMINDDVYAAIQDAGMTVEQFAEDGPGSLGLDQDVAAELADDFADCGDLLPQVLAEGSELDCGEENLTNDQLAEFLSYSLLGHEPGDEVTAAYADVQACLDEAATTTT